MDEWHNLGRDDVDWKTRVVKEKVFQMQTKNLTRMHEEPVVPESEKLITVAGAVADAILEIKPVKPDAIIFDCDGVLLDMDGPPWLSKTKATPRENTIKLLRLLWRQSPRHPKIIILTGRPERIRMDTVNQLLTNSIFYDELVMNDILLNGNTPP
jgi:DNA-binding NarL/FixJ family response regulator